MSQAQSTEAMGTVHSNVRAEIARAGLPQSEVAAALGINQTGISRRLSGRIEFSASELARLSELLRVPVSAFFPERAS